MYKQKHLLQDAMPDDYPHGCGIYDNKSTLEKLLESAKKDDENITISCLKQDGIQNYSYDNFICEIRDIEKGKYSRQYSECRFSNIEIDHVCNANYDRIGKTLTYDVTGDREDLCYFMMREQGLTRSQFYNKYPSRYDYANKMVTKKIDMKCHSESLNFFKNKLEFVKNFTVSPMISILFSKNFKEGSFLTDRLWFKYKIEVTLQGRQCEVDFILKKLNEYQKSFLKNQSKQKNNKFEPEYI
jgi:hypothetical protein